MITEKITTTNTNKQNNNSENELNKTKDECLCAYT